MQMPGGTAPLTAAGHLQAVAGFAWQGQWHAALVSMTIAALGCIAILVVLRLLAMWRSRRRPKHAAVVVLGDIGRSPRMMNHAVSLAKAGFRVSLIGYAESGRSLACVRVLLSFPVASAR